MPRVVQAAAAAGDTDRAAALVDRAEELARSISDPERQASALTSLVQAAAAAGTTDRAAALADQAEELARSVSGPKRQAEAITALAVAVAAAGHADRAEALARSIGDPYQQALALTAVAEEVEPGRGRLLVGWAFRLGDWTTPLDALVQVQPGVLKTIADELLNLIDRQLGVPESVVLPEGQRNASANTREGL